jgi:hypothetical protein
MVVWRFDWKIVEEGIQGSDNHKYDICMCVMHVYVCTYNFRIISSPSQYFYSQSTQENRPKLYILSRVGGYL